MAHAVVRTDLLAGTDVRSELVSVRYQPSATMTAIDNGNIVALGDLETGSRTVFKGATPAANTPLNDVVLICSPEVMYDERLRNLDEFFNAAGEIARGYRLHSNDIFSATADAFDTTPAVGKVIELQAGTKMKVVTTATAGSTVIGKVIDKNVVGRYTYYVVEVD